MRDDWKNLKLGQIGQFNNGINKDKNSFGRGYPFVNLLDIFDKDVIDYIPKGLVNVTENELNRYDLKEGDILFVRSSVKLDGVGKVCVVARDLKNTIYSGFIIRLRQSQDFLDKTFASYYLNSRKVRKEIIAKATLSANSNINQESLKTITLIIPPLPQQRKIARILSTCNAVIEKTEAAIAKYQGIKQGMMHDLFTRGIDPNTGQLRPKYEDAPHLYKPSELGWIPKEWDIEMVVNRSKEVVVGIVIKPTQYYADEGYPLLRSQNVNEGKIVPVDLRYISPRDNIILNKSRLEVGDLVTVRTGHPGTSAVVSSDYRWANCVDLVITRTSETLLPHFLMYWLNSSFGKGQVLKKQGGIAQQHFNVGEMKELLVAIPSAAEQKKIASELIKLDKLIDSEHAALSKYRQLKAGLMQDLLMGKVEVSVGKEAINAEVQS